RRAVAHAYGRAGAAQAPAVDLVDRVRGRAGPLPTYPGVHAEVAAPAHGARGVDLNDRAGMRLGRRRETDGLAARRAPIRRRAGLLAVDVGEREQRDGHEHEPLAADTSHAHHDSRSEE